MSAKVCLPLVCGVLQWSTVFLSGIRVYTITYFCAKCIKDYNCVEDSQFCDDVIVSHFEIAVRRGSDCEGDVEEMAHFSLSSAA